MRGISKHRWFLILLFGPVCFISACSRETNPSGTVSEVEPETVQKIKASIYTVNIAPLATPTASSIDNSYPLNPNKFSPSKAFTDDLTTWWRSRAFSYQTLFQLEWPSAVTFDRISIHQGSNYTNNENYGGILPSQSILYFSYFNGQTYVTLPVSPGTPCWQSHCDGRYKNFQLSTPITTTRLRVYLREGSGGWNPCPHGIKDYKVRIATIKVFGEVAPQAIDEIKIRLVGSTTFITDSIPVSYRKAKTTFEAVGFLSGVEKKPVAVDWILSGGEIPAVSTRSLILSALGESLNRIGNLASQTTSTGNTTTFTSYLPGNMQLQATLGPGKASNTISIRIKQPTVCLSIKVVENSGDLSILPDWVAVASMTWGAENLLKLRLSTGEYSNPVSHSLVTNEPMKDPTIQPPVSSAEWLLPPIGYATPTLIAPLVWDTSADSFWTHFMTQPRQFEKLLEKKRGGSREINVYITKMLFKYNPFEGFFPITIGGGWAASNNEIYRRKKPEAEKISDSDESGIGLLIPNTSSDFIKRHLAHEVGHMLIQNGDEHYIDGSKPNGAVTGSNLMNQYNTDNVLDLNQWVCALGYNKAPASITFISEE